MSTETDREDKRRAVGAETRDVRDAAEQGQEQGQGALFAGDAERAAERAIQAAENAAVRAQAEEGMEIEGVEGVGDVEEGVPLGVVGRWKKRVTFVVRTAQIWAFLFHVLIKLLRQKLVQRDEVRMSARRRKLGRYLCRAFLKLGPTFIKIGQVTLLYTVHSTPTCFAVCLVCRVGHCWSIMCRGALKL